MAQIEKPTLLIITGPQGSGNHLFSKIFSLHSEVTGWTALYNYKWVGHDQEPFQKYWQNPEQLKDFDWSQSQYYMTSISCPYILNKQFTIPKYKEFITEAKKHCNIILGIIGRDKNVLKYQQLRVRRGEHTAPTTVKEFAKLKDLTDSVFYLSQELFFLYGKDYLSNLSKQMIFPVASEDAYIDEILAMEANSKYVRPAEEGPFDQEQFKINY
jgi:hypothetical protein